MIGWNWTRCEVCEGRGWVWICRLKAVHSYESDDISFQVDCDACNGKGAVEDG